MTQPHQPADPTRYELVITGDVEVIPGPLSKIRAIANEALADRGAPADVHTRCRAILDIIDGESES